MCIFSELYYRERLGTNLLVLTNKGQKAKDKASCFLIHSVPFSLCHLKVVEGISKYLYHLEG